MYKNIIKRFIDILLSLFALITLSPLLLIIWGLLIICNKGAGAFFTQERPGKNAITFKVIKFKSMTDERDTNGVLLSNTDRLTTIGAFIRKTSLDEIPQLINILKGDMSFIGPRPLLKEYLPYYTEEESRRHSIRPGMSGLAQVSGRNSISWDERLKLDVNYVDKLSFTLDCYILIKTVRKVLSRENVVVALDPKINIPLNEYRKNCNAKTNS